MNEQSPGVHSMIPQTKGKVLENRCYFSLDASEGVPETRIRVRVSYYRRDPQSTSAGVET